MFCNDDLFEIFSWLSARDLFKFAAVSKSPKNFMSESFFVRKQCKNMQRVPDSDFFIQPDLMQYHSSHQLEKHTLSLTRDTNNTMPRESLDFLTGQGQIIASSNGLLCLRNVQADRKPLCLLNPVTRNYLEIPYPYGCERRSNFETNYNVVLDCTTDEERGSLRYFLMVLEVPPEFGSTIYSSMIFSPELNIWRDGGEVDLGQRRMIFEYSVREKDTVYMISDNSNYLAKSSPSYWPYIVAYDISDSSCSFLSLPKRARKGLLEDSTVVRIFKWGDDDDDLERSICLVKLRSRVFTVWVLPDKEITRRWTCVLRMRVRALTNKTTTSSKVAGFTVINGGVLLFATEDRVYSYDLKNGKWGEVCAHECGDMVQLRSCSSTLRSCGSAAVTLTGPYSSSLQTRLKKRRLLSIDKIPAGYYYSWMIMFVFILPLLFNLFGGCLFE